MCAFREELVGSIVMGVSGATLLYVLHVLHVTLNLMVVDTVL